MSSGSPQAWDAVCVAFIEAGDNRGDFAGRAGRTEKKPLNFDATFMPEVFELLFGFDTFGRSGHSKANSEVCDGANNVHAVTSERQVPNEGLINLDLVETEASEVIQAGIPGAEVV